MIDALLDSCLVEIESRDGASFRVFEFLKDLFDIGQRFIFLLEERENLMDGIWDDVTIFILSVLFGFLFVSFLGTVVFVHFDGLSFLRGRLRMVFAGVFLAGFSAELIKGLPSDLVFFLFDYLLESGESLR